MGWRTDQAYEDAQRAERRAWWSSLTWKERLAWHWRGWWAFYYGGATGLFGVGVVFLLSRP